MAKTAKRMYQNDYPSVTGVLDGLRKVGLEWWFKTHTIEEINKISKRSLEIGTTLHEAIQSHIESNTIKIETQYPEEVKTAIKSFMLFKKENPTITLKRSEIQMTSETYKVNGTLDCMGEEYDELLIADWKSSECKDKAKPTIYDEAMYQVSAYVVLHNDIFGTEIKKAVIVSLAKDKVAYSIARLDEEYIKASFANVFLPMLKVWNFKKQHEYTKGA